MDKQTWEIEWHDGMSVGIPEIDEDHKRLLFLVRELDAAILGRMSWTVIRQKLQLLLDDAEQHFPHEEKVFRERQYPGVAREMEKHAHLLQTLRGIQANFAAYRFDVEWIQAALKVKELLLNHLLQDDMQYAVRQPAA